VPLPEGGCCDEESERMAVKRKAHTMRSEMKKKMNVEAKVVRRG
jgi:hypothetical protein